MGLCQFLKCQVHGSPESFTLLASFSDSYLNRILQIFLVPALTPILVSPTFENSSLLFCIALSLGLFNGSSTEAWRLPTKSEMPKLLEKQCINPAVNPFVFPDMEVTNFWTESKGLHQDQFRCSVYTYQGRVFCRQARNIEQPFLLVKQSD